MKIRPLRDRIIVERIDEEETSKGGILIPDTAKEKSQEGKVVAVGKGGARPAGGYVLIGHQGFGASGHRFFGTIPYFFKLMLLSSFVKQLRGPGLPMPTRNEAMAVLRELLEAGKITPIIDRTYPLSEAREALRHMMEDQPLGKVIITA